MRHYEQRLREAMQCCVDNHLGYCVVETSDLAALLNRTEEPGPVVTLARMLRDLIVLYWRVVRGGARQSMSRDTQ